MNPGFAFGGIVLAVALIVRAPAQNLGLGAGARSSFPPDSSMQASPRFDAEDRKESALPRKNQINRRLGLSARNFRKFDPRDFEARGRELHGRFYEIGEPPAPGLKAAQGSSRSLGGEAKPAHSRQWMMWAGLAGVAGASAGALGYYMMTQAHPSTSPPPKILDLSDDPLQP